jgi:integrase/recombinase XerD
VLEQPDVNDVIGLSDRAIIEVLYSTGIRRMEVLNLCIYDLGIEHIDDILVDLNQALGAS